jgi:hypothetical protein
MPTLKRPEFAPEIDPQVAVTKMKVANVSQPEDRHVTRNVSRDQPFLMDGDVLMVSNHDEEQTYVFSWAKRHWVLEPGQTKPVLFEALVDAMGDPRSMENQTIKFNDGNGNRGQILERHYYLSQLFGRYAIENEAMEDYNDPRTGERKPGLVTRAPNVSCETLDGVKITFPVSRPDMLPLPVVQEDEHPIDVDAKKKSDQQEARIGDLESQIQKTNQLIDKLLAEREGTTEA